MSRYRYRVVSATLYEDGSTTYALRDRSGVETHCTERGHHPLAVRPYRVPRSILSAIARWRAMWGES